MCSYPLELEGKKAMRKHQIQHIVVKHLVNIEAFKKTMLETLSETWAIQYRNEEAATGVRTEKSLRLEREEKEQQERMEKRMERERLALQHEPEMKKLEVHMKLGLDPTSEKVQ